MIKIVIKSTIGEEILIEMSGQVQQVFSYDDKSHNWQSHTDAEKNDLVEIPAPPVFQKPKKNSKNKRLRDKNGKFA
jgi:hypothetical protein